MKTIQWFLLLTQCHFQPLVTFSHSWLEMAPGERQKPYHFLHTSEGKQILIFAGSPQSMPHQRPDGQRGRQLLESGVRQLPICLRRRGSTRGQQNQPAATPGLELQAAPPGLVPIKF